MVILSDIFDIHLVSCISHFNIKVSSVSTVILQRFQENGQLIWAKTFMKFLYIPATSHEFELRFLFKGENYIELVEIKAR